MPDGNRISAFSVASTAIAAAQWSSSQVGHASVNILLFMTSQYQCNGLMTYASSFQPKQSSEGRSEYSYLQEGYMPMSQVSRTNEVNIITEQL